MAASSCSDVPTTRKPRWYTPTPAKFLFAVLVMQCVLFLSAHYRWFWFNERKGYTVLITVAATAMALLLLVAFVAASRFFKSKLQFSLATLLLMVPVVAVPCAWMAREMELARRQKAIVEMIESRDGFITYARDIDRNRKNQPLRSDDYWLAPLLGVDFLDDVYFFESHRVSDEEFKELTGLENLRRISIEYSQVSDVGLAHVAQIQNLECLWLDGTRITDSGLTHLAHLVNLRQLGLSKTNVSDAGMAHLNGLVELDCLHLDETYISDAGLKHLTLLTKLETLSMYETDVTQKRIRNLQRDLPNCRISPEFWVDGE
jgi:hypothetical protein